MQVQSGKLLGNNKNYKTLTSWTESRRFPHAILIEGAKGSGRSSFAKEIAKAILCDAASPPCNNCRHCIKMDKEIHPDFLSYSGEGGARSFHVDLVRELRVEAWISPNDGERKVIFIAIAEEMTVQAQNALLKIIEEPPAGVYFILTCGNKNLLLTTIISRVSTLTMEPLGEKDLLIALKNKLPNYTGEEYSVAANLSGGVVGKAEDYLLDSEARGQYEKAQTILNSWITRDELSALSVLSGYEKNRQGFNGLLGILKELVHSKREQNVLGLQKELTILQATNIIDIIDGVEGVNMGNISPLLLTTILSHRVVTCLKK